MTRLYLVRHGRAASAWDGGADPGLDAIGTAQAAALPDVLPGPLPVVVSPLRRTRETAAPLGRRWRVTPRIEPRVGEIPTPDGVGLAERGTWLRDLAGRRWAEVDGPLRAWRQDVLTALWGLSADTVVVTHYVAINVAVGWAAADDRLISVAPANASITVFDTEPGGR